MKISRLPIAAAKRAAKSASIPNADHLQSPFESAAGTIPKQARSRERVAKILHASTKLIRDGGLGRLTMSAIARVAKIPIGSLYQYFPTKGALVHRLFQDRLLTYNQLTLARLEPVVTRAQCAVAARRLIYDIYLANRQDPVMQEIWGGVQADRDIRYIHLQDNEFYTLYYARLCERVGVRLSKQRLINRVRVVNEMWDGVIRLAITRPKAEAEALIEDSLHVGLKALELET